MRRVLRIATRESQLALWQARFVARQLRAAWPGLRTVLVPLLSSGDRDTTTPLYGMGGIGVFAKEVHEAVLAQRADCAVHSCKDLPTTVPGGMAPPVLMARADARDCLIGAPSLAELPQGARVGSSSLRRRTQLAAQRPDLRFVDLRGNVQTRLRKLAAGEADATILAAAGLARLGLLRRAGATMLDPHSELVPAVAQGALALDCRADDPWTRALLRSLEHRPTSAAVTVERQVLAGLRGGCSLPLGCHVRRASHHWRLDAVLAAGGGDLRRITLHGPAGDLAARALTALQ